MLWDPWLPRCSKNLARSCQDNQNANKRVNRGSLVFFELFEPFNPRKFSKTLLKLNENVKNRNF